MFIFYVRAFLHCGPLTNMEEGWIYHYRHKANESVWAVPGTIDINR